ncbi:uncharacterized protein LOC132272994 [Cornus florida]|uniref:uncharacterized protein LOC132272994 n=1 Tax=Cornus florida TaxID=4283 RepID=UPI00289A7B77|nr:uncharacterized protein LOC132272994 [Cornus florida]
MAASDRRIHAGRGKVGLMGAEEAGASNHNHPESAGGSQARCRKAGGFEEVWVSVREAINRETYIESDSNGSSQSDKEDDEGGVQINCFSEESDSVTLHFQIIRLQKQIIDVVYAKHCSDAVKLPNISSQIYAWIGCNSANFGNLYAALLARPKNTVSVTSIIGGASDYTGSGIARRLVLKTGLNVILACNIPKNSPMLEADAEKKLVQKLINLGYARPKSKG